MRRRTRSTRRPLAAALVAALAASLAACTSGGGAPTHLSVATFAGLDPTAQAALDGMIREFEDANPDVVVDLQVYGYDAQTYPADLAAGKVPTVFLAPFADAPALVGQDQVAHVEDGLAELPYADGAGSDDLDPALTAPATADGALRGVPVTASGARLLYDRDAFRDAGLDASDPPTTWAELRAAARTIASATGEVGLGLPTEDGAGGATLVAIADALGGRVEQDGKLTLDGAARAADLVHDLRWDDAALGTTSFGGTDDVLRAFAAGKVAMVLVTVDPSALLTRYGVDTSDLGIAPIPLTGSSAGVAVDGMTAFVSPRADAAQQDAALRWIDTAYLTGLVDGTDASLSDVSGTVASRALALGEATGGPGVSGGVPTSAPAPAPDATATSPAAPSPAPQSPTPPSPTLPSLTPPPATSTSAPGLDDVEPVGPLAGLAPVNVLLFGSDPGRTLVAPPVVAPRTTYLALDTVLRQVLTDRDADVDALLTTAQRQVERTVAQR